MKYTNDEKYLDILVRVKDLFLEFGLRSLSMDDISRKLAISKKTLYQYVSSKEDLVEKIFELSQFETEQFYNQPCGEGMNAIDILLEASKFVSREMKKFNPVITFDLMKYYPVIFNKFLELKRELIYRKIRENIVQGKNEGIYRESLNPDLIARLYVNNLVAMHQSDFLSRNDVSFTMVFEVMFENHIRAITNRKGLDYFESKIDLLDFQI